jgi:Phosphate transport regulator (distant homolog of PhoU)
MGNLSRKTVDYFEMFAQGVSISLEAAKRLQSAFSDGVINIDELKMIKEAEHNGDKHVHQSLKIIDAAFITPIDRTDIIEILKGIENVTDSIDEVANNIYMMHIKRANGCLVKMVELAVLSCEKLHDLMIALKNFKKDTKNINELIIEVNRIEEEGDAAYLESMRSLFDTEKDPVEIIKHKEIYGALENTLDCCEDVADMVEKIMISAT